jgi:hypothetical protein
MSTDAIRPAIATLALSASRLTAGLHVKGDISGKEDLHIDGTVEGLIQLEPFKLTVGANAKLTGDVVAREVIVHGSIKGNLRVRDRIEIKKDRSRLILKRPDLDKPAYAREVAATVNPKQTITLIENGKTTWRDAARRNVAKL